jgi:antitoxin YefM
MKVSKISDFRKDIKTYLDRVVDNVEPLVVNRSNGRGVVIVSLDEYNALLTTQHELSSRANIKRLDSAIASLEKGKGKAKSLIED